MMRTLLALCFSISSFPALATDAEALRHLNEKYLNPLAGHADAERGVTEKGCVWSKVPAWFRDKHHDNKGVFIIQDIQNYLIGENISASNECSCETLYPNWDEAIAIYDADFKDLNAFAEYGTDTHSFLRKYHSRSEALISAARSICQKAGVF